jgi:hypothetical protein
MKRQISVFLISLLLIIASFVFLLAPTRADNLSSLSNLFDLDSTTLESITLENMALSDEDLSSDTQWSKCKQETVVKLQDSFLKPGLNPQNVFCFWTNNPLEVVAGFIQRIPSETEQFDFDQKLKTGGGFMGWFGNTSIFEIGDTKDSLLPNKDTVIFRRDNIVAQVLNLYGSERGSVETSMTVAKKLDERIVSVNKRIETISLFEDESKEEQDQSLTYSELPPIERESFLEFLSHPKEVGRELTKLLIPPTENTSSQKSTELVLSTNKPLNNCDSAYPSVCIPSPLPDLDCKDISYKNFRVNLPDPHKFDRDKDGIGCES